LVPRARHHLPQEGLCQQDRPGKRDREREREREREGEGEREKGEGGHQEQKGAHPQCQGRLNPVLEYCELDNHLSGWLNTRPKLSQEDTVAS
jgi:hypothetical protein